MKTKEYENMIVDGREIAKKMQTTLSNLADMAPDTITVHFIVIGDDPVVSKFVSIKEKFGKKIGVATRTIALPKETTQFNLIDIIEKSSKETDGIVVQLPLPSHIDSKVVLEKIPVEKDIDFLSSASLRAVVDGSAIGLPPVTGAIKKILDILWCPELPSCDSRDYAKKLEGAQIVLVGEGMLVGRPTSIWLTSLGIPHTVLKEGDDLSLLKGANFIISGVGKPGLIKPDMLRDEVFLFDAGTSEKEGKLAGDADPKCREKCTVFTPMPGGLGPITVAVLYENLIVRKLARTLTFTKHY